MENPNLTDLQRRILASLPCWHEDEAWAVQEQGGPQVAERSHTLQEVHANLHEPGHPFLAIAGAMSPEQIHQHLADLEKRGFAEFIRSPTEIGGITHDQVWRMTKEGHDALNYVSPASLEPSSAPAAPATVDVQPATSSGSAAAQ